MTLEFSLAAKINSLFLGQLSLYRSIIKEGKASIVM